MQFYGTPLALADLGTISDKARATWDYFQFDHKAEPGTLCAQVGWDGWRAIETGDGVISAVDEGRD